MKAEGCCIANPESKLKSCPCPDLSEAPDCEDITVAFILVAGWREETSPQSRLQFRQSLDTSTDNDHVGLRRAAGGLYARGRTKTTSWLRKVVAGSDSVIDAKGFSKMEICGEGATGAIITGADKVGTVEISSADITGNCCARDRVTVGSDGLPLSALCQWHPVRAWPEHL